LSKSNACIVQHVHCREQVSQWFEASDLDTPKFIFVFVFFFSGDWAEKFMRHKMGSHKKRIPKWGSMAPKVWETLI